ncbi:uncharacterized protein LOC143296593 [Babylonia areolata]|uniref:uncharacterized protein LOC143296593 n=1 Tax=Babylonia areolata TaxID=304850 RepID=UPI003FD03A3A
MVQYCWCQVLSLAVVVFNLCGEGTGFVSGLYKIGVLKVGQASRSPTMSGLWCDGAALCGKFPTSLRILTLETALDKALAVIQQVTCQCLWRPESEATGSVLQKKAEDTERCGSDKDILQDSLEYVSKVRSFLKSTPNLSSAFFELVD